MSFHQVAETPDTLEIDRRLTSLSMVKHQHVGTRDALKLSPLEQLWRDHLNVEKRFEGLNPEILKDKAWVHDSAEIITSAF